MAVIANREISDSAVDNNCLNYPEKQETTLLFEKDMVEQESFQTSQDFPDSLNSSTNGSWYIIDPSSNIDLGSICPVEKSYELDKIHDTDDDFNILGVKLAYCEKSFDTVNDEEQFQSQSMRFSSMDPYFEAKSPLLYWGSNPLDFERLKMDDVFQVDEDDLVHSPTLAKLNANDESLFDNLDTFNISSNRSSDFQENLVETNKGALQEGTIDFNVSALSNDSQLKSQNPAVQLCFKKVDSPQKTKLSVPEVKLDDPKILPSCTSFHKKEKCILKSKSKFKEKKTSRKPSVTKDYNSNSQDICINVQNFKIKRVKKNLDQGGDKNEIEDNSEEEMKLSLRRKISKNFLIKKKTKYFWQYNMQSKGPKSFRMLSAAKSNHGKDVPGITDPVFSSNCPVKGVKHSGKARKGDGNDLTPNPRKLYNIGIELEKLNQLIDHLTPVNEVPVSYRTKSRKEKNKLASRACRLKKKAQHEANKLKLFGLQQEQKHLSKFLIEARKLLINKLERFSQSPPISPTLEALTKDRSETKVAGCSADFVNKVLKIVDAGDNTGGLNMIIIDEN